MCLLLVLASCFSPAGPVGNEEGDSSDEWVAAVDQQHTEAVVGGIGTPVVQSFTPAKATSVGIDIRAHGTGSLSGSYRITLYADYNGSTKVLSNQLATGEVYDVPRGTDASVRWDPVDVTPGTLYYFEVLLLDGKLVVGTTSNKTDYAGGEVLEGGGNLANTPDIYFTSYYADFDPE